METKFGNWREWIRKRFGDKDKFIIETEGNEIVFIIRSSNPEIKTKITFWFMRPDDDETLYDIYFGGADSTKSNTWLSHFTTDPEFKPESRLAAASIYMTGNFIPRLENEWLYIPLKKGWTEEVYYVGQKIYRAKLSIGLSKVENWDEDVKYPIELNALDYLKILFKVGLSKKRLIFDPMEE